MQAPKPITVSVVVSEGEFICPHCGRHMAVQVGQYGLGITNTCEHKFEIHQQGRKFVAIFNGFNV